MEGKGAWIDGIPAYVFENRIGERNGETVAVLSHPEIDTVVGATETGIYEMYMAAKEHNAKMPDDLKAFSQHNMEQHHTARKAIQEYKNHPMVNEPLETPPVDLEDPYAKNDAAANDPVYDKNEGHISGKFSVQCDDGTVYRVGKNETGEIIGIVEHPTIKKVGQIELRKTLTETEAALSILSWYRDRRRHRLENAHWSTVQCDAEILKYEKKMMADIQTVKKANGIPLDMPEVT